MRFQYMICPVHDLGAHAWSNTQCNPNSVFVWRTFEVWGPLNAFISSLVRTPSLFAVWFKLYQLLLIITVKAR